MLMTSKGLLLKGLELIQTQCRNNTWGAFIYAGSEYAKGIHFWVNWKLGGGWLLSFTYVKTQFAACFLSKPPLPPVH